MFLTHHDAQLFAVSFGNNNRTIVGLGGWIGSCELWIQPFTDLSKTWRCITFDHRGSGATIAPVESITVDNMVNDVLAVLDAFQVNQCVLAAESAGAVTAILAVMKQPHRFNGLVIVDGLFRRPVPTSPDPFVEGLKHHYDLTINQFVDSCLTEPINRVYQNWGRQILTRSNQAAAIQLYECLYGIDLSTQVQKILQPTLILHGERDQIVPAASAHWLAEHIPNSQLRLIPDAGHVPTITHAPYISEAICEYFVTLS